MMKVTKGMMERERDNIDIMKKWEIFTREREKGEEFVKEVTSPFLHWREEMKSPALFCKSTKVFFFHWFSVIIVEILICFENTSTIHPISKFSIL